MHSRKLARGYSKSARQRARWAKDAARKQRKQDSTALVVDAIRSASVSTLRTMARELGLTGYSKLRKAQLQELVIANS